MEVVQPSVPFKTIVSFMRTNARRMEGIERLTDDALLWRFLDKPSPIDPLEIDEIIYEHKKRGGSYCIQYSRKYEVFEAIVAPGYAGYMPDYPKNKILKCLKAGKLNFKKSLNSEYLQGVQRIASAYCKHIRTTTFTDDTVCASCGSAGYEKNNPLCVDHIIPTRLGGSNTPCNVQVLCNSCNLSKGQKVIRY
jgi:hypothetical protein